MFAGMKMAAAGNRKAKKEEDKCKVCTGKMPKDHKRYGGPGCNACAAFYQRSIPIEHEFVCPNLNQCLIEPSSVGKHCQKCRFAKCLEIGMLSREYINAQNEQQAAAHQQQPQQQPEPEPQSTTTEELKNAQIADTMLATALQLPTYMENYLEFGNPEIINISLELVKNVEKNSPTPRIQLLTAFLLHHPIPETEFPLFIHLCFCKMEYPSFEPIRKQKMKALQNDAFVRLPISNIPGSRFLDLVILANHFLPIFYANF